ncbi:hypothetical protein EVG20_g5857 [Dentipellis fragilis]|uniref:Uncharacterized protein n=1 Tax=Dentipellis fragilis TaxID=205917 RepID=A0A4Y9YSI4_9AGAM|nr:hypothetical protein EVG20_g5857 [Dentipellis fragilis]
MRRLDIMQKKTPPTWLGVTRWQEEEEEEPGLTPAAVRPTRMAPGRSGAPHFASAAKRLQAPINSTSLLDHVATE